MLNETSQPGSYFVIVIKNTKKSWFYLAIRFRAIVSELDKENSTGGGDLFKNDNVGKNVKIMIKR